MIIELIIQLFITCNYDDIYDNLTQPSFFNIIIDITINHLTTHFTHYKHINLHNNKSLIGL